MLIDQSGSIKGQLTRGEHKSLQTDRAILMLGPEQEIATVNRIYRWFVDEFAPESVIAERLNRYLFGLARNKRLTRAIGRELHQARELSERTGQPARRFRDLTYRTRSSWSRRRRVVAKAEHTAGKSNPRFVVSSLSRQDWPMRQLYEDLYCARAECENRIKEAQLDLFAERLSTATFRANQLRLWLSSAAYVLMHALRRIGLKNTELASACANTLRLKLLKIGAVVTVSVQRVKLAMSSACPSQQEYIAAFHALNAAAR